jgi:hypothetical protein
VGKKGRNFRGGTLRTVTQPRARNDYFPGVKSFRGRLVRKERSIDGVLFTLGELSIPNKPGRVDWWGQCRLHKETRELLYALSRG